MLNFYYVTQTSDSDSVKKCENLFIINQLVKLLFKQNAITNFGHTKYFADLIFTPTVWYSSKSVSSIPSMLCLGPNKLHNKVMWHLYGWFKTNL